MIRTLFAVGLIVFLTTAAFAQVAPRRPVVRASGTGVVSIQPDQARISVGVTTTGDTAQEAGDRNAAQTTAVLNALRQLLGANADIRTINYSLSQLRDRNNLPVGFSASNTVQVTSRELTNIGLLIDTAGQAGATNISGVSFSLRDSQPARLQALRIASVQARTSAEAIATGLGLRVGNVLIAEQGGSISSLGGLGAAPATPIEVGALEVSATVTIEAELTP
jgi:uncharacterized protein YggE